MPKINPRIKSIDDLLGLDAAEESPIEPTPSVSLPTKNTIITLPPQAIRAFRGHPFRLYEGDRLNDLVESISEHGGLNPAIIRKIGSAMRHISYDTTLQQDIVGKRVMQWNGIPLLEAGQTTAGKEILDNNETQGTNSTTTSIYAVKFGSSEGDQGVTGLTNGGVQVEDLGQLQEKPAYRTRIEFYCGLGVFSGKAAARLKGVVNG